MTIHKEGYTTIALSILFIFIINAFVDYKYYDVTWLRWFVYIFSAALFIIVLQFFRNPSRSFSAGENLVICPADGKVVVIEETEEGEYFKDNERPSLFITFAHNFLNF